MQLVLKNIYKSFEDVNVVNDFNISVEKGEIISLLGPSGCGKTTILKIIGGFLRPNSGEVILDGKNITNIDPENRDVTTVFQSFALFPHMNVIDNIIYGLKFKGYSRKEALRLGKEYIELIGLENREGDYPQALSGGQKQRVALARSLILNPKVLLLDEALSSLDARLRIKMREEVREIGKKFNITMIFVTHDKEDAFSVSDRVAVMNKGCISQIEEPRKIYENPNSNFVREFVGDCNKISLNGKIINIRPEDMAMHSKPIDEKCIEGVIKDYIFMGFYIEYKIEIRLTSKIINVKSFNKTKIYSKGQKVFLHI